MIGLFSFLGNPGSQYKKTRHNLAWLLLEHLTFFPQLDWKTKFKGEFAPWSAGPHPEKRIFLRPKTFMNKSGESIQEALKFYKLSPKELLVVHDDVEMAFGKYSLRFAGGLAGHNGLRSIVSCLGTEGFYRLRLGVGKPEKGTVASHVLGRFSPQEEAELELLYGPAEQLIRGLLASEPESLL